METEKIIILETVLDHLTGEELGTAIEKLNGMPEILDAIFLTGIGKKNRPAGLLQVLCRPEHESETKDAVFRHTHALGLRRSETERYVLPRHAGKMETHGETVATKIHEIENRQYARPEADAISNLADRLNLGAPALRFEQNSK